MSSCGVLVFDDFSEARFRMLAGKVAAIGVELNEFSGESGKDGFWVVWDFDPERRQLRIECTERPFLVSCEVVNTEIEDLVAQCEEIPESPDIPLVRDEAEERSVSQGQ